MHPMQLADLLPYLSSGRVVHIWVDGSIRAMYDGRDSIPHSCDCLLVEPNGISTNGTAIEVYCYEE